MLKRKRTATTFKAAWLKELVETETIESKILQRVELGEIFNFSEDDGVICTVCADAEAKCDFANGKTWDMWKLDYLKRHITQKIHLDSIRKLKRKEAGTGINCLLTESEGGRELRIEMNDRQRSKGEQVKILIDNVLLALSMNTSMLSVMDIHDHMAKYLKLPESWRSKNYGFEFVECIDSVVKEICMKEIREAEFHTLIVDESTDISVTKMLIIYIKYRPAGTKRHQTVFAGMVKLTACDSLSIFSAIKNFYMTNSLDFKKMVMFTSDGASVMLGKRNGVAARIRAEIPHLTEQHCVAHREDLGIDDAWGKVSLMKNIETLLRTVYTVFSRSSVKKAEFEELANVADNDVVSFRPLNEVRWMSRHFAVKALMKNYNILIEYFEKQIEGENDPIAKYCLKELKNPQVHVALTVLNEVLAELADLCTVFQRSCISTIEAVQFAKAKISKLKSQYLELNEVHWSDAVKILLSTDGYEETETAAILRFIERVCLHLQERFPDDELREWVAFDTQAIQNQASFDYGKAELSKLATKYEHLLAPGTTNAKLQSEYDDLKYVLKEKMQSGTLKTFADVICFVLTDEKFSTVATFVDICGTFQASSADAERGFSLMNNIKTKLRNRLEILHLDMIMRIKFYLTSGHTVDLDRVYNFWKGNKNRREYAI
jgi:Domain of unknown function (DUF4371)